MRVKVKLFGSPILCKGNSRVHGIDSYHACVLELDRLVGSLIVSQAVVCITMYVLTVCS